MAVNFKYSCTLEGHSGDVRAIKCPNDDLIISASRDKSIKIWLRVAPNLFQNSNTLTYHQNYVTSLDFTSNSQLISGSNDKQIFSYDTDSQNILGVLEGHTDNVCAVRYVNANTIISCSWDHTIRIWIDMKCSHILRAHSGPVWSIAVLSHDNDTLRMCSAGADKKIFSWVINLKNNTNPTPSSVMEGHTDCIRSLVKIDDSHIASCGNDAAIKVWNVNNASLVSEGYSHTNFIYCLSYDASRKILASVGEDRSVRLWNLSNLSIPECYQVISVPSISVWCVDFMPNGDVVIGGSDLKIRVFTTNPDRQASHELMEAYSNEIASNKINAKTSEGSQLTQNKDYFGVEALTVPGKSEGQLMVVKDGDNLFCFQWSSVENQWNKVGDVVGTDENTKKTFYNGQEYDFVFSIETDPSMPMLKLPFNKSEDPYTVAQNFINNNNLPQDHLDTVAKFICENAGLNAHPQGYTGSGNFDPYTGDGSMPRERISYVPISIFISMSDIKFDNLLSKLSEFNSKKNANFQIPGEILGDIRKFDDKQPETVNSAKLQEIIKTLQATFDNGWDLGELVPVLDFLRYSATFKEALPILFEEEFLLKLFKISLDIINPENKESILNTRLTINIISNALAHGASLNDRVKLFCLNDFRIKMEQVLTSKAIPLGKNKMIQVSLATYFHNVCLYLMKHGDDVVNRDEILENIGKFSIYSLNLLLEFKDIESDAIHHEFLFRILITAASVFSYKKRKGEKVYKNIIEASLLVGIDSDKSRAMRKERLIDAINKLTNTTYNFPEKVQDAAFDVLTYLKST